LNGFLGVLWTDQGVTAVMVGALIAFSAVVETGTFVAFKTLLRRFKPTTLILISCLAGVVRWSGLALSPPLEVLFLLQVLHGLTYAVGFMACTNLIADLASEDVAAEAQSFFGILQSGVSVAALMGFGALAGAFGARAFFGSALLAAIGAVLVGFAMSRRASARIEG
jgi:PPP family 3-phenylpropionic acid transporter